MKVCTARVLYNKEVAEGYFLIGLNWPAPSVKAGQFVMLRVDSGLDPILRRPLGIYRVFGRGKSAGVELMYQVVGKGTRILSEKSSGDMLDVLGPLGNGFPAPDRGTSPLFVAGGMGIVPLYMFVAGMKKATVLYGARGAAQMPIAKGFKRPGLKLKLATEDGSVGVRGYVTELLKTELGAPGARHTVYACGPAGMLKSVAAITNALEVRCHVSLERAMACGIGVCLGCAVKRNEHGGGKRGNEVYKMICSDGPVFDAKDIDWDAF